jgi:hypothetical protein
VQGTRLLAVSSTALDALHNLCETHQASDGIKECGIRSKAR